MSGFFNKMFDMNHDGKLDAGEQFLEFMMFNEMMKEEEEESQSDDDWDFDSDYDDYGSRSTGYKEPKAPKREKTIEQMNKDSETTVSVMKGLIAFLCVIAVILWSINISTYLRVRHCCVEQAKEVAEEYGLDYVRVKVSLDSDIPGAYYADYYIDGMETLSNGEILSVANALWCVKAPASSRTHMAFLDKIHSDGDEYLILTSSGTIYVNGKNIYDLNRHSDSYEKSSTSAAEDVVPYVGMYVSDSKNPGWINSGTDYTSCSVPATKYHYKTDDAYYVFWVNPKTNCIIKVQGGPSTYTPKKSAGSYDSDDEYNAKDFSNPEDFYDYYYDDFFDYYDAEDYWYDHCD